LKPKHLTLLCIVYLLVLVIEIFAEYHHEVTKDFTFLAIMQPLVVPSLIIYMIYSCRGRFNNLTMGVLAGLSFDWVSDIVLTLYRDAFNIPSILGYFAGHVCYSIAFASSIKKKGYKVSFMNRFIFSLPPIFYIVVYYVFIYNYMTTHAVNVSYLVPVTLYAASILTMATTALWRMGTTMEASYWCISAGALFYMLSDSITGYDHFVAPIHLNYVASMFTYGVSLLLFTIGAIIHKPAVQNT
jgi:uncharacterized membrane protein YhhN